MASQDEPYYIFKLETPNKNQILTIYPSKKLMVFTCAALLHTKNFQGVLTSHSHMNTFCW